MLTKSTYKLPQVTPNSNHFNNVYLLLLVLLILVKCLRTKLKANPMAFYKTPFERATNCNQNSWKRITISLQSTQYHDSWHCIVLHIQTHTRLEHHHHHHDKKLRRRRKKFEHWHDQPCLNHDSIGFSFTCLAFLQQQHIPNS